jgi:hypothetical protein
VITHLAPGHMALPYDQGLEIRGHAPKYLQKWFLKLYKVDFIDFQPDFNGIFPIIGGSGA